MTPPAPPAEKGYFLPRHDRSKNTKDKEATTKSENILLPRPSFKVAIVRQS